MCLSLPPSPSLSQNSTAYNITQTSLFPPPTQGTGTSCPEIGNVRADDETLRPGFQRQGKASTRLQPSPSPLHTLFCVPFPSPLSPLSKNSTAYDITQPSRSSPPTLGTRTPCPLVTNTRGGLRLACNQIFPLFCVASPSPHSPSLSQNSTAYDGTQSGRLSPSPTQGTRAPCPETEGCLKGDDIYALVVDTRGRASTRLQRRMALLAMVGLLRKEPGRLMRRRNTLP